jgi:ABC-2 type transport system permease protein
VIGANWAHLKAFVWLRWRLAVNQTRRSGPGGAVVSGIVTVMMTTGGGVMLIIGFLVGFFALRTGPSSAVMVVWDGAIVGFVFFWMVGLMSELQRSDALSLDRFLYLPVSPTGAFLINYLGSSVSLSLVLVLPAMIGLSTGLVMSRGPGMLLLFPLVAAFFLMMTAVTYQFRGWLASMMENPRRRRTIMAVVPVLFILLFQLPNIWFNLGPGASERREARRRPAPPTRSLDDGYARARMVSMIAPPGWLAYGAEAAADGRVWPALAGVFGMTLIGAISLRRAYTTTLRLYRGNFDSGRRRPPAAIATASSARTIAARQSTSLLEWRLPWVSERVSSVAVTGFRSWMRASEMKMALFAPVMMLVVFTRMFAAGGGTASDLRRPLMTSSLAGLVLILGMVGPLGNQFGYDRAGFLAFVLGPAPRRDVLLGKNLSVLPFALVIMTVLVGVRQWLSPMRLDHLVALLLQLVSMYLLFCLAGNLLSIIGPLALKPGSGMPAGHQGIRSFGPFLLMLVSPVLLGLTHIPLGIEALLSLLNWFAWFPAYLVFGAVQAVVTIWLYRLVLDWEGDLLQRREPEILEIVSSRIE